MFKLHLKKTPLFRNNNEKTQQITGIHKKKHFFNQNYFHKIYFHVFSLQFICIFFIINFFFIRTF